MVTDDFVTPNIRDTHMVQRNRHESTIDLTVRCSIE